jgi:membrane-bound lytic murein transglycosylase D
VPSEIEFGGLELKLTEGARRLLQSDIDLITKGQKAFQTKVERADLYFPIIEKIFKEENIPDDFKFLALQESSLVSDAVSSSNAVGYWQFKKESAVEVGLRVDQYVDERINIVASSRGAAKYLKRNNAVLQNWIYALLSYNLGLGGVKTKIEEKYIGARKMVIDQDIHWYIIRFLAHKLAYENVVGKNVNPTFTLVVYDNCLDKSLSDIARETSLKEEDLRMYNKWILKNFVPSDKTYYVILPVTYQEKERLIARNIIREDVFVAVNDSKKEKTHSGGEEVVQHSFDKKDKKKISDSYSDSGSSVALFTSVNKVKAIKAREGDTPLKLALAGGISVDDFLRYNDMKSFEKVVPGQIYFLQPKRTKATVLFHAVEQGEDLRTISQKYGMKINSIRNKNRMSKNESLQPGRVLWLKKTRPKNVAVEIKEMNRKEEVPELKTEKVPVVNPVIIEKDTTSEFKKKSNAIIEKEVTQVVPGKNDLVHEVKAGETLFAINRLYGTSIDSITTWNQLTSYDLKIGQKLIVKKEEQKKNGQYIEHKVVQGETLYGISRKYGVTVDDIRKWNGKMDNSVNIGEILIIQKSNQ